MSRKHRTKDHMYPLLEEYERRDVKQREYCKEKDIRMATFGYWLRKFRKERSKIVTGTTNNGFKEIHVKEQYSEPMIEIKYPSGVVVQIRQAVPAAYIRNLILDS